MNTNELVFKATKKTLSRDECKDAVLKCLFEPVHWDDRIKKVFQDNFSLVFAKIAEINKDFKITKKMQKEQGLMEADKNELSILLQGAESHMILNVIVKRLRELFPDMPILTIHDALLMPREYLIDVRKIMEEEFLLWTGITPSFSMEILPSNQNILAA